MKFILLLLCAAFTINVGAQTTITLKAALLEQLKTTHNQKDWFVPVNTAVEHLTAKQAMWKDSSGNHSVGQLVTHLVFWNSQQLAKFKGEKPAGFSGNNDETFSQLDDAGWASAVKQLDEVLTQLEKLLENASDKQLQQWAPTFANISTHNAYHTGQIIFVRKQQGSWDPANGVK